MTSDRGTSGGAEMKLSNMPVTPKTPTLNPNANVFHSKTPATPPESTTLEWNDVENQNNIVTTPEGTGSLPFMNGDIGKLQPGVNFPPTPESPLTTPTPTDFTSLNGAPADMVYSSDSGDGSVHVLENSSAEDQLKGLIRNQLEYYFSRENLANDSYLVSQMDPDQYVSIATVANFNQVKRLTNDMELVVQVLRESPHVQVDEKGEKVRPLHKRCVVILREVPQSTPVQDVENLFSGENCPRFMSCEFAHNNNWYVTFTSDEDAQRAYQYLREEVQTFQGKPIMARIKAKPMHSTFVSKNGVKHHIQQPSPQQPTFDPNLYNAQNNTSSTPPAIPPQQPQRSSSAGSSGGGSVTGGNSNSSGSGSGGGNSPFTFPQQVQNAAAQYIISQQVTNSYPFFPPNTVVHPWAGNPMTAFFDPGTAFAANGYTPTATFKLSQGNSSTGGTGGPGARHGFQTSRNRNQNKPHRGPTNQDREMERDRHREDRDRHRDNRDRHRDDRERNNPDNRSHDRHVASTSISRSSPRNNDSSHSSTARRENHNNVTHVVHASVTPPTAPVAEVSSSRDREPAVSSSSVVSSNRPLSEREVISQAPRYATGYATGRRYQSRRKKEEDGAKNTRQSSSGTSSQPSAKESTSKLLSESPRFDLEATSFPPLPGSNTTPQTTIKQQTSAWTSTVTSDNVFENKMSDVVKGTARPSTRETPKPSSQPAAPTAVSQAQPQVPMSPDKEKPSTTTATSTSASSVAATTSLSSSASSAVPVAMTTTPVSATASSSSMTTSSKTSSSSPSVSSVATSTSVTKVTTATSTVSTATCATSTAAVGTASLPTPPQSPQKVSRATSTDTPPPSRTEAPSISNATTQTPATQTPATPKPAPKPARSETPKQASAVVEPVSVWGTAAEPPKLSYAQMVQRTKEREAERARQGEDRGAESSKDSTSAKDASANGTSARPAALREQQSSRLQPRPDHMRKDRDNREETRDQRLIGRRAKENRDRRGGERDRDTRDRFRDRRRDRETDFRSNIK